MFTIDPDGVKVGFWLALFYSEKNIYKLTLLKETLITNNFPKIKEVYENVGYPYSER